MVFSFWKHRSNLLLSVFLSFFVFSTYVEFHFLSSCRVASLQLYVSFFLLFSLSFCLLKLCSQQYTSLYEISVSLSEVSFVPMIQRCHNFLLNPCIPFRGPSLFSKVSFKSLYFKTALKSFFKKFGFIGFWVDLFISQIHMSVKTHFCQVTSIRLNFSSSNSMVGSSPWELPNYPSPRDGGWAAIEVNI